MRLPDTLIRKISVALFAVLFISNDPAKGQGCYTGPLTISVTTTPATCVMGGTAAINISNGNQPYIYTWSPNVSTTNMASNLAPDTYTVSVTDTRCHTLPGQELVTNGDFSAGNTGFSSSYIYCNASGCLQTKGAYAVGSDPTFYHDNFLGAAHSAGNCMIINGAEIPATCLWSQTVTVTQNTNYVFSAWVSSMNTLNPAQLQFSINGSTVDSVFSAPLTTNDWRQFCTRWNSGSKTTAVISIVNQSTATDGNDIGLDDISFRPCSPASITFDISVENKPVAAATYTQSLTCEGINVQFLDESKNAATWFWDFGDGTTSKLASPQHTFSYNGNYYVKLVVTNPPCLDSLIDTISVGKLVSLTTVLPVNVFTPNGDEVNDCFHPSFSAPEASALEKCAEMEVYDRWGVKIYESSKGSGTVCWDGTTLHNAKASEGTYYYIIKFGESVYKGYVTLLRNKK